MWPTPGRASPAARQRNRIGQDSSANIGTTTPRRHPPAPDEQTRLHNAAAQRVTNIVRSVSSQACSCVALNSHPETLLVATAADKHSVIVINLDAEIQRNGEGDTRASVSRWASGASRAALIGAVAAMRRLSESFSAIEQPRLLPTCSPESPSTAQKKTSVEWVQ